MATKRHRVGKGKRAKGPSQTTLNRMARDLVGDGKSPNLFFVSANGKVVTISTDRGSAVGAAEALGETKQVVVEDRKTGEVWGNGVHGRWLERN